MVSIVLWWSLGASVFSSALPVFTLGSQAKCKPTLWVLDVWATMRPTCTSFLLLFFMPFFLFYDTGFPEPPWSGNHRFWHQSSGATVFYSGWGRSWGPFLSRFGLYGTTATSRKMRMFITLRGKTRHLRILRMHLLCSVAGMRRSEVNVALMPWLICPSSATSSCSWQWLPCCPWL